MIVNCRKVTELVTDHLEHRLSPVTEMRVSVHLWWCRSCRAYVAQMQTMLAALKDVPPAPVPAETRAALLAHFTRARGGSGRTP